VLLRFLGYWAIIVHFIRRASPVDSTVKADVVIRLGPDATAFAGLTGPASAPAGTASDRLRCTRSSGWPFLI
jgi:hypothetical protein